MIDAPPGLVWREVADIGGHDRWQVDVRSITFTSDRIRGLGTTYDCDTKLGLVRMRIPMEVIHWDEGRSIGVRYEGTLSGGGRISLTRRRRRRTKVTWSARVRFPWWLGGPFAAFGAVQVLRVVWKANLGALERQLAAH